MSPLVHQKSLLIGVNRQSDPSNWTDLEKQHVPVIEAPAVVRKGEPFEVSVEVGKGLTPPMERGHFIQFIDLYADETFLARVELTAEVVWPKATLRVRPGLPFSELRAYARCNLHGTWMAVTSVSCET